MITDIGNQFSGTSIKVYGGPFWGTAGLLNLELDGETTGDIVMNSTTPNDVTPIYRAENLQDGDHQLWGNVSLQTGGGFALDYLECVAPLLHSAPRAMY